MCAEILGGKEPSSMVAVAGFKLELSVNFELEEKCSLLKTGFPFSLLFAPAITAKPGGEGGLCRRKPLETRLAHSHYDNHLVSCLVSLTTNLLSQIY